MSAAPDPSLVALEAALEALGSCVVALSGGVDSSVVAAAAARALGPRMLAVTGVSASLSPTERDDIRAFARAHDIPHVEVATDEATRAGYVENSPERCFFCKDTLYGALRGVAAARGLAHVVDGTHVDDLAGHRPGRRAAASHDVRSPLVDIGATKDAVRAMARALGLAHSERPSQPCLASRIAYGLPVTTPRLAMVQRAEDAMRALGFPELRVRHHDAIARIEVPKRALPRVVEDAERVVAAVKDAGFTYVTLDLAGLRSGSLLEVLERHQ